MKKKTNIKATIREIVREEVAMAIHEVITELKQPPQVMTAATGEIRKTTPNKKIVEKKTFSKNSVLNDMLNETAQDDEWKKMGGGTYTSDRVNEVASSQYGDLMNGSSQQSVNPNDPMAEFLNKDYRDVMKKVEKKSNQNRGI